MANRQHGRIMKSGESTMKESAKSFAFVKAGDFSGVNDRLLEHLRRQFPNLDVDVIDILDFKAVSRSDAARLLYYVAHDYGLRSCLKKSRINSRVIRTVYCFRKLREHLLRRLSQKKYVFTFQTQSLFDASIPDTPHFLYTDHTHLANLTYPGRRQTPMASAEWVGLERSMYQNARLNFTMSTHVSRSLVDQYGCLPTRVECVYAGSNVAPAEDGNLSLDRFAQKSILFVGIDWERKGGPVLLKAFREVRRSHPTARLTIVGCAPNVSMPGCCVMGRVQPAEVSRFYQTATVFCLPTTVEPFGIVFLEAFAHGLPIVATNIGAIPDFVEQGRSGYMVDCNDAAQLANRLNELLANPARCAAFGVRGQALVGDRYTWQATAEKLAFHIKRCDDARVGQLSNSWAATNAGFARLAL
jgi:glycosyltransferase involved in cell wall biosynthesis